ncbi:helix-turn-helix transcriptional regulator [Sinomonas susongensis]|uniref:helix-turn-helix transcriptional regulator n=1 Tax=Sinomonas susongensis TaxID=1324851 RepID=UPI0011093D07|nr:helix-turn-helix transcriptional regulator [Sinomonas susongensis]
MVYGDTRVSAVAAELRVEKSARQVSMDLLAYRSGVPVDVLFQYLAGIRDMPLMTFLAICDSLEVDPSELLRRAQSY